MARAELRGRPADVTALRERIEQWRRRRRGGDAMPAELWSASVSLARGQYTVYEISKWLRVDYGALKRRVVESAEAEEGRREEHADDLMMVPVEAEGSDDQSGDDTEPVRFVQLSGEALFGQSPASERLVEVSSADGRRMTIRQPAGPELDVVGLVASFWGRP